MRACIWCLILGGVMSAGAVCFAQETAPVVADSAGDVSSGSIEDTEYAPLFAWDLHGMALSFPLSVADRVETVTGFPIDSDGKRYVSDPSLNTRATVGLAFNSNRRLAPVRLLANVEADVVTGRLWGGASPQGEFMPDGDAAEFELRKASLQLDAGPHVHFIGGVTTSHWGMGLLANDGAHDWEPGSASFTDPRGGDRVVRGVMLIGPFTSRRAMFDPSSWEAPPAPASPLARSTPS